MPEITREIIPDVRNKNAEQVIALKQKQAALYLIPKPVIFSNINEAYEGRL